MRVNKIRFSKIKNQFDLLMMKAAYILAERAIIGDPSMTGWQDKEYEEKDRSDWTVTKQWTPESQHEAMEHLRGVDERNKLIDKINNLEDQGRLALEEEDYERLAVLKEVYEILKNKLNKL